MQKIFLLILFGFCLTKAIEIDESSSSLDILINSQIYISDKNSTLKEVKTQKFKEQNSSIISLGFAPNRALWIRFNLKNSSPKEIKKLLEYANPLTEEIILYDFNISKVDGTWHISKSRTSINPIFLIKLNPFEEREFFIKASSKISTIIAELRLWKMEEFYKNEFKKRVLIAIFFTIMFTLLFYNFFIYLFTKDRAYFYYILYLIGVIINEATYSGVAQLFILSQEWTIFITKYIMLFVAFLVVSIILFTREFLHTKNFPKIDKVLKFSIYFTIVISLLSCNNFIFNSNIIILLLPIGFFIAFTGFFALFKGVKEAKFYVVGWSVVLSALIATNLQTLGILKINEYVKYLNDFAFSFEAILFSVALAHRIKITNEKLMNFQKEEQIRLQKLVDIKTKELQESLKKEELLYRELNHRVKNNFAMILSLIKLQILKSETPKLKEQLSSIKNRVESISKLYEMLQINSTKMVDTREYFLAIVSNIRSGFDKSVDIDLDIKFNLPLEQMIYCGLILNELVTNSFKYAFREAGEIKIKLYKEENLVKFIIEDNGVGLKEDSNSSLGLLIVETLVKNQLFGKIKIESKRGVKSIIEWKI